MLLANFLVFEELGSKIKILPAAFQTFLFHTLLSHPKTSTSCKKKLFKLPTTCTLTPTYTHAHTHTHAQTHTTQASVALLPQRASTCAAACQTVLAKDAQIWITVVAIPTRTHTHTSTLTHVSTLESYQQLWVVETEEAAMVV
jgi:hypothetical protein